MKKADENIVTLLRITSSLCSTHWITRIVSMQAKVADKSYVILPSRMQLPKNNLNQLNIIGSFGFNGSNMLNHMTYRVFCLPKDEKKVLKMIEKDIRLKMSFIKKQVDYCFAESKRGNLVRYETESPQLKIKNLKL